jgi:hypothetical protein
VARQHEHGRIDDERESSPPAHAGLWPVPEIIGQHNVAPDSAGGLLRLELVGPSGPSPETQRAQIISLGDRWAAILMPPPRSSGLGGKAVWQIRATRRGGLMTREILEISFLP